MNLPSTNTVFSQSFENEASVEKAGGTLIGSPLVRNGLFLNGVDQSTSYQTVNTLLSHSQLTMVWKLTPNFNWDDDNTIYITDTNPSTRYALLKYDSGTSHALCFYCGGTNVLSVNGTVYGDYWRVGESNVIVVTCEPSGVNKMYLNGTNIKTTSTTWSVDYSITDLKLGVANGGGGYFDGIFSYFSIHNRIFTQTDISALQTNSLYNYQDKAEIWLDMLSRIEEPSEENLISDGDMEASGNPSWLEYQSVVTKSSDSFSGTQSLKVSYDGVEDIGVAYQTALVNGQTYTLTAKTKSNGTIIPIFSDGDETRFTGEATTEWQDINVTFVAGGDAIMLGSFDISSGFVLFDDVVLLGDGVVETTKDKTSKGNHAVIDGCTFQDPGFLFDGVNDKLDQTLSDPTGTFTVGYKKRNESTEFESDLTTWNLIKSSGSFSGTLDYLAVFPFELSSIQMENLAVMWSGAR